jgi:hypothetical protein
LMPSMVSENEMHCVCAAAIVQGVLQQTIAVSTMVGRIYPHPYTAAVSRLFKLTYTEYY